MYRSQVKLKLLADVCLAAWDGTSGGERERLSGIKQVVTMVLHMQYYPLLEQLLGWMLGLSAVLVHMAVVTREYFDMWKKKGVFNAEF